MSRKEQTRRVETRHFFTKKPDENVYRLRACTVGPFLFVKAIRFLANVCFISQNKELKATRKEDDSLSAA